MPCACRSAIRLSCPSTSCPPHSSWLLWGAMSSWASLSSGNTYLGRPFREVQPPPCLLTGSLCPAGLEGVLTQQKVEESFPVVVGWVEPVGHAPKRREEFSGALQICLSPCWQVDSCPVLMVLPLVFFWPWPDSSFSLSCSRHMHFCAYPQSRDVTEFLFPGSQMLLMFFLFCFSFCFFLAFPSLLDLTQGSWGAVQEKKGLTVGKLVVSVLGTRKTIQVDNKDESWVLLKTLKSFNSWHMMAKKMFMSYTSKDDSFLVCITLV